MQFEKLQKIIEYAHKQRPDLIQEGCIDSAFADNKEYMKIIFSHSFLKAFFGICYHKWSKKDEIYGIKTCKLCKDIQCDSYNEPRKLWQEYAKNLVLLPENERIDYLYDFIKEK